MERSKDICIREANSFPNSATYLACEFQPLVTIVITVIYMGLKI